MLLESETWLNSKLGASGNIGETLGLEPGTDSFSHSPGLPESHRCEDPAAAGDLERGHRGGALAVGRAGDVDQPLQQPH